MANDWCNRKTWSAADKADFFTRLSRRGDKAKYLSIQARSLEEAGTSELLSAAITLWDQLIIELASDTTFTHHKQIAVAHSRKAGCYQKLGDVENAVASYRRVFAIERVLGSPATLAFFGFGKLVAEKGMRDHFDEALSALDAGAKYIGKHLPADTFLFFGIRALIAAQRQETECAKRFAKAALEAAQKDCSGVPRRPGFGLVEDQESKFFGAIEAIATSDIHSFSN